MNFAPPAWETYWEQVVQDDLLAARRVLELNARVQQYVAENYLGWSPALHSAPPRLPHPLLDWERLAADADADVLALSSTEKVLVQVAAAVAQPSRTRLAPLGLLPQLGFYERALWTILVEWGTRGAYTVAPRPERMES